MAKKRRCTYAMRRKKACELRDEVRKLKFQLDVVKTQLLSPVMTTTYKGFREAAEEHAELLAIGRNNQLQVAKAHSAISGCMQGGYSSYSSYPLHSNIRLGKDWDQRRATLLSIQQDKLQAAVDFVMDPIRILDHEKSTYSDEIFETDEGDWCCIRFETIQFPGVESLEQVFDAVMRYFNNTELLISEKPGNFAVRDDYECLEGGIKNSRIIATNNTGTTLEASTLVFSQLLDKGDGRFGGEPIGVVAIDSVDQDDLFPWVPSERVRQDGTGAIVLTTTRTYANDLDTSIDQDDASTSSESNTSEGEDLVTVTMRRADYIKLYRPTITLSPEAQQDLRDGFSRSGEFVRKEIRRMVYNQY